MSKKTESKKFIVAEEGTYKTIEHARLEATRMVDETSWRGPRYIFEMIEVAKKPEQKETEAANTDAVLSKV